MLQSHCGALASNRVMFLLNDAITCFLLGTCFRTSYQPYNYQKILQYLVLYQVLLFGCRMSQSYLGRYLPGTWYWSTGRSPALSTGVLVSKSSIQNLVCARFNLKHTCMFIIYLCGTKFSAFWRTMDFGVQVLRSRTIVHVIFAVQIL